MESKTPRTDDAKFRLYDEGLGKPCVVVKAEFAEKLETELAEARAEIERLKKESRDNSTLAARQIVPAEMLVDDLGAEIGHKDRLIEQMRSALTGVCEACPCDTAKEDQKCKDCDIRAALSAAERGERCAFYMLSSC